MRKEERVHRAYTFRLLQLKRNDGDLAGDDDASEAEGEKEEGIPPTICMNKVRACLKIRFRE